MGCVETWMSKEIMSDLKSIYGVYKIWGAKLLITRQNMYMI